MNPKTITRIAITLFGLVLLALTAPVHADSGGDTRPRISISKTRPTLLTPDGIIYIATDVINETSKDVQLVGVVIDEPNKRIYISATILAPNESYTISDSMLAFSGMTKAQVKSRIQAEYLPSDGWIITIRPNF